MSETQSQGKDRAAVAPAKKPQSGELKPSSSSKDGDSLENKKKNSNSASDDAETTKTDGSQEDQEAIEKQLATLPALEQQKKMRERPSILAGAKWYDKLFFSWTFKVITHAQTAQLKLEDLGGLRDEDLIQGKLVEVEEIFQGQKDKNIFLAVVQAFRDRYIFSMFGVGMHCIIHMFYPMIIAEIIRFMQAKDETDFNYGIKLIVLLMFLNICMMLLDCHTWYNNLTTGCMAQKIITAMTVKKQLKLTAATSKNYEAGQIHSVRGATHRLVHFCWELSHFVTTPVWLTYCSIRLFQKIGWTYLIGLSLFVICYYFDRHFHRQLSEEHHEQHKLHEKRMNLTSESFENIKTIKFYGWDEYFKKEILKYRSKEVENGQRISNIYLILTFVWEFLPNLMSSLSFIIYLGLGHSFELAEVMEMLMLFEWIRGALHHALNMRQQIADLRICVRRIQDYLAQDEVSIQQIVSSAQLESEKSEFAVKIKGESFSWGLQTQDIDEMFEKMHRELKGLSDDRKSKDQLREELESKQKKAAELKKQRKLDNVVCLKDIDLKIKKGQFVCIIGKVGSGKSSLLSALIGDLLPVPQQIIDSYQGKDGWERELGQAEAEAFQSDLVHCQEKNKTSAVEVNGSIAYTQQSPWIRNKIVRENIVYNQPFNYEKYVDTIQYCELESDLSQLKAGDQTEIGEKGVNLSGGQKARLGLARAVYADKDIYLMDDPISALDAHVRKQIINNVYFGVLKDRTRILVTHAIDFLNQADHIIMMEHGRIKAQGTYDELEQLKEFSDLMDLNQINKEMKKDKKMSKVKSTASALSKKKSIFEESQESFGVKTKDDDGKKEEDVTAQVHPDDDASCQVDAKKDAESPVRKDDEDDSDGELADDYDPAAEAAKDEEETGEDKDDLDLKKKKTLAYPSGLTASEKKKKLLEYGTIKDKDDGKIIDDEADEQAEIQYSTIEKLMSYYGHWSQFGLLIALEIALTYFWSSSSYLIGQWAEDKSKQEDSAKFWAHVFKILIIVLCQAASQITKEWVMRVLINKTLKQVHDDVLARIMNAPVNTFFDVTPNGSIMKRFSDDMHVIEHIVHCFMHCCSLSVDITYMFILICYQNLWALAVVPVLFGYAKYIWDFTLKAKRQAIQLLQSQSTPIHTHQGEIMNGTSTIRAFNTEDHAVDADAENQNSHLLAQQVSFATFTWYSTRLMFASCASTLFTGTLCLYSKSKGADAIMVAMAFQQVVHLGYRVNGLIHISGDFEKKMASVQKCFKLLTIPQERKDQERYTEKAWPAKGEIKFEDVELKYRPATEMVLRKLSFGIKGGEKVGVVGRTGAGKSTITLALTRIIEICGGNIKVDGVDLNKISLQQVREAITIIPQEPTLFKGTLKFNLDPENKRSDEDILALLESAGLVELILKKKKEEEEKKKKLEAELTPEQLKQALADKQVEDDSLLNFHVQSGGENLSSGEKSLVCICRAILRKNKIVILDEATANIDIQTEQTIQKLIKESFKDCTMIVVAHRLQTIIASDRVLVLDHGKVAEFDSPEELRKNPESHFTKLINEIQKQEKDRTAAKKKEDKEKEEKEKKDKESEKKE